MSVDLLISTCPLSLIVGFTGVFYNIVPFEDVSAAGRVAANFIHLPTSEGALLDFMGKNDTTLAQMFCFFVS